MMAVDMVIEPYANACKKYGQFFRNSKIYAMGM